MKVLLIRYLPPLVWMGVIFSISSLHVLPGPQVTRIVWWDFLAKKSAHMIEYAILYFLWQKSIHYNNKPNYRGYLLSFLIVIGYAITDEYHQSFISGRHPKAYDVGYDTLGAGLMYLRLQKWL